MTKFSVIIPCFNAARTLPETLDAIQAQTCPDWEALCVDDGSTDETIAVIQRYAQSDPRVRLLLNDGKGPSRARNLAAMNEANGEWLAFCDADDIWTDGKLAQVADHFTDPSVHALFGQIAFFERTTDHILTRSTAPSGSLSIPLLLGENPVCTMSNLSVRTDVFHATGGFDERVVHNEDLDWLIRLVGSGGRVDGINALHTYYRSSPSGLSSDLDAMKRGRAYALRTARQFGFAPSRAEDAIYARYLARRALRLGQSRFAALGLALSGIYKSPSGFFNAPKRGALTLLGACAAVFLPARVSRHLFA